MGIKTLIADVTATQSDLGLSCGKWAKGGFTSSGVTWTGTAAFTVLMGFLTVTAGAAGFVTMGTTADADAIFACTSTLAGTYSSLGSGVALDAAVRVKTAVNCGIPTFAAGDSLIISAGNAVAGNYHFFYIDG